MSNLNLITSRQGTAHVTVTQAAAMNKAASGAESGVYGSPTATIITGGITVGELQGMIQGRQFNVDPGATDTISIPSCSDPSGKRIDIVCVKVTVNTSTSTQSVDWYRVAGTEASSPVAPTYTEGDLDAGDTEALYGIFQVAITGSNITSATLIASEIPVYKENRTLLWENASPTSGFASQTITLSQSAANFDRLVFEHYTATTSSAGTVDANIFRRDEVLSNDSFADDVFTLSCISNMSPGDSSSYFCHSLRLVDVAGASVTFHSSYRFYMLASGGITRGQANGMCVPYRIYGIKD